MKVRGFEKITKYAAVEFSMPERKTQKSAGYDICLPEDIELLPGKLQLVPTGIKAYMQDDEYLGVHIRSSIAVKKHISLVNNQGIIDATIIIMQITRAISCWRCLIWGLNL